MRYETEIFSNLWRPRCVGSRSSSLVAAVSRPGETGERERVSSWSCRLENCLKFSSGE